MITPSTVKAWLPLLQAMADGKHLQLVTLQEKGVIEDTDEINPVMFTPEDYRIKPQARRWWINVYPKDVFGSPVKSRAIADEIQSNHRVECIEVVEVLK